MGYRNPYREHRPPIKNHREHRPRIKNYGEHRPLYRIPIRTNWNHREHRPPIKPLGMHFIQGDLQGFSEATSDIRKCDGLSGKSQKEGPYKALGIQLDS